MTTYPIAVRLLGLKLRAGDQAALKRVVAAHRASGGNLTKTAKKLGMTRLRLYKWRTELPALREAMEPFDQSAKPDWRAKLAGFGTAARAKKAKSRKARARKEPSECPPIETNKS